MILGLTDTAAKLRATPTPTPDVRDRLALLTTTIHSGTLLPVRTEDGEPEDVDMNNLHDLVEEPSAGDQDMIIARVGRLCLPEKIRPKITGSHTAKTVHPGRTSNLTAVPAQMAIADTWEAIEVDQISIAHSVIVRLLQSKVLIPTLYVSHLGHLHHHRELVTASVVLVNVSQQRMDISGVEMKSPRPRSEARSGVGVEVAGDRRIDRVVRK
jgi:hypothetical protein